MWPWYTFFLVKQLAIGISLFLFFSSSSLGSLEQLSTSFGADSQTLLWTLDDDFSSKNAPGRRSLKRPQRGKSPLKQLARRGQTSVCEVSYRPDEESFISRYSRSRVYQQINVYRI
jgi:hypothetical protein